MELRGFEPLTSWVRSRRSVALNPTCLQRVWGERLGCRNKSRNIVERPLQDSLPVFKTGRPARYVVA